MNFSIELSPLVPWPVLIAGAVACVLVAGLLFWRGTRGAFVRTLSLVALVAAVANPTLREEEREALPNIALVAVDDSMSQSLGQRRAQTAAVLADLEAKLGRIANLEVRTIRAGAGNGKLGTQLFGEIGRTLSGIPADRLAGLVVVSDGQIHDVPTAGSALGIDAPVHVLLTGAQGEFDRRIAIVKAPRFGILNGSATAEIRVESKGEAAAAKAPARIVIRREGEPDIETTVAVGAPLEVPLNFPHAGMNVVEVELEAVAGELTEANNRVVLAAEAVRENLRVLLVSGEPHAGERTWRNLLKSDAAVELVHFTILRPPHKQDGTPINELSLIAFPTRELFQEKLEEFDLIIFDRYQRRAILPAIYIDNVARYVEEHGGAVLVAAGEEYASETSIYNTPLSQVLPASPTGTVTEQPFKPALSEAGRRHPVTRGLPGSEGAVPSWGRWFRVVDVAPPEGQVLLAGPDAKPLVVLARKGKGRVALMLSDHAWLWARGFEGGGPHTALLRRMAHWLMKEPDLEEERLLVTSEGLKLKIERRSMLDEVPPVEIIGPNGFKREVALGAGAEGTFVTSIEVDEPGFYKLASGELTAVALAGTSSTREMTEVVASREAVAPLVASTGGGAFFTARRPGADPANGVDVPRVTMLAGARVMHGSGWLGLEDRKAYLTKGVVLYPVFNGIAALALLLGLVSLAWWREGR